MRMDQNTLMGKLTEIFRDVFDDDDITLRGDMTAKDVEGWDSVAHIRLMLSIEQKFGFRFEVEEISELRNVGELAAAISKRAE
ncbi:MAG TPA: acyl carrier protein [Aliidongia sp.]|nr:acyl carrier protein [Aliidongia sp.]